MKQICVYCGSSPGSRPEYIEAARKLGKTLAERKITLVYGGSNVGLMGLLARAALDSGGDVVGVITKQFVELDVAFTELPELIVVDTMHERKTRMAELADGFIALPGGLGTLEELFEILTWSQLGLHKKPCGLLNVQGYYDKLGEFLDHAVAEKFIAEESRRMVMVDEDAEDLLRQFESYHPVVKNKAEWVRKMSEGLD
ncbi:MAG: TIGR00730 family Rossman fold protein [Anaerolineaceae bacterium]